MLSIKEVIRYEKCLIFDGTNVYEGGYIQTLGLVKWLLAVRLKTEIENLYTYTLYVRTNSNSCICQLDLCCTCACIIYDYGMDIFRFDSIRMEHFNMGTLENDGPATQHSYCAWEMFVSTEWTRFSFVTIQLVIKEQNIDGKTFRFGS